VRKALDADLLGSSPEFNFHSFAVNLKLKDDPNEAIN
jgi:hypothetical protein